MTDSASLTSTASDQPTDQARAVVAIAWPTGRPIYPYTADEIAEGVDPYTNAMKARAAKRGGDA